MSDTTQTETPTTETPPAPTTTAEPTALEQQQQRRETALARETLWALSTAATFDLREMSLGAMRALSDALAKSDLVPKELLDRPVNVFAVLLKGAELGLSAMTSVAEVMVIKGKLTLSAHLQNALVLRSGKAKIFRIIESTKTRAVMEVQRHDWTEPTTIDFDIEEADALGLTRDTGKLNQWHTQPKTMLRRRVTTRAAREFFGDVVTAYDPEEMEEREDFAQPAPAAWGKAPAAPPPQTFDDGAPGPVIDVEPEPETFERPSSATRAGAAALVDVLAKFVTACAGAKDRRQLDAQQSLLAPVHAAADAGDPEAQKLVLDAERAYNKHLTRINESRRKG